MNQRVTTLLTGALDMAGALPGTPGDVIGMASPAFKEFVNSFELHKPEQNAQLHSSVPMQTMLADAFMRAGLGHPEGIGQLAPFMLDHGNGLGIPADQSSSEFNAYESALRNYLQDIGPVQAGINGYDQAYRDALTPTVDE